jgi:hypothetical protein
VTPTGVRDEELAAPALRENPDPVSWECPAITHRERDGSVHGQQSLPNMDTYYFNRHLGAASRLLPVLRCGTRWLIKPASLGH